MIVLVLLALIMGTEGSTGAIVDAVYQEEQGWGDLEDSIYCDSDSLWFSSIVHFIAGPVDIDCSTGEVVIAEGADISSASIKFWRALEDAYPRLFIRPQKLCGDEKLYIYL